MTVLDRIETKLGTTNKTVQELHKLVMVGEYGPARGLAILAINTLCDSIADLRDAEIMQKASVGYWDAKIEVIKENAKKKAKKRATGPKKVVARPPATPKDREVIISMTKAGKSMREIGKKIGRSPSFVWYWQQQLDVGRSRWARKK